MCKCINITPGSYGNQEMVTTLPDHMKVYKGGDSICLDRCISEEVQELWQSGITTTGCCCGHNWGDLEGYIGVIDSDIPKMKELGYEVHFNPCRPNDEDSFKPKYL